MSTTPQPSSSKDRTSLDLYPNDCQTLRLHNFCFPTSDSHASAICFLADSKCVKCHKAWIRRSWKHGTSHDSECVESLSEIGQSDCDVVFTMLPGDAAVNAVLPSLMNKWPRIIVDCSTVGPATSRHWHSQVAIEGGEGSSFLDAPVSGGVKGATDATLTFMVGADHVEEGSPFETIRPLLQLMGQRVVPCGGPGTGAATKLCNNLALAAQMIGICEAFNLGEALGVDPVILSDVMNTSTAKSWSTNVQNPHPAAAAHMHVTTGGEVSPPASRDYQGGFGTRLILKDLGLAVSAGQAEGVALPLGSTSKELYRLADLHGYGDKDFGVMLQFLRGK